MIKRYVTRGRAYELKNYSVYLGIVAYMAMIISGDVIMGAVGKLVAETLRIPYFLHTDAKDMARLSYFFIAASTFAIAQRLL
jgi:hypothetical protein